MSEQKTKVGVIGCGNISGIYLKNATQMFDFLEVAACADLLVDRAEARAEEFGVPKACTPGELLADPAIEIVINLTIPHAHAQVALDAIEAGKSVYNEKPLAVTREDGKKILAAAEKNGVRVSGAPDTFLGAGAQTCRKLIDDGVIGEPTAVTAYMMGRGHETWHPDPDFYYQPGGGPMFDMGPYYLTALINLLGPVKRLTGATKITFPERTITSEPKHGTIIKVNTPTHIAGLMDFESGVLGTIITSFDVYAAQVPCIQVFGTEGTLNVPDPNGFGGPVRYWRPDSDGWVEVLLERPYAENSRCIGVADMAMAIRERRAHRANGRMAYHVLDVMHGFLAASDKGRHIAVESTCERPAPLPEGLGEGQLD